MFTSESVDPGSIPGRRSFVFTLFIIIIIIIIIIIFLFIYFFLKVDLIPLSFMLRSNANVSGKEHIWVPAPKSPEC